MIEAKRPLKVFLCHASVDKPKVRELYRTLKRRGVQPWLDAEDLIPGQNWEVEIPKALLSSDAIIICLTPNSVDKEGYVQKEIKFALDKAMEMPEGRIFIIPARLEECELPFSLRQYQAVNLYEKAGYTKLMQALKLRASQLERATVELPKAGETTAEIKKVVEEKKPTEPKEEKPEAKTPKPSSEKVGVGGDVKDSVIVAGSGGAINFGNQEKAEDKKKEQSSRNRVLEAAIEKQVSVGVPTSLFVWIKRLESRSIISVVSSIDEDVVLDEDNVRTKGLEIEFPIENGRVLPAGISLRLVAHEFAPSIQQKQIVVPPEGDSEVCTFIITPTRAGKLLLNLEVIRDQVSIATRSIHTTAIEIEKKERSSMVLVSIPIIVFVHGESSAKKSQSEPVSVNIGGNVQGNIIIGDNNQISQESKSSTDEKMAREKTEREYIERITRAKAEAERKAKEEASRLARQKAEKEKLARERELASPILIQPKQKSATRQSRRTPNTQIIVALIGAVATVIAAIFSSPISSVLFNRATSTTVVSISTKSPTRTKTLVPAVTKTKVPTITPSLTPTPVPQSSILFQDNFDDGNADGWDPSGTWVVKKDETGNYVYEGTGPDNYPQTWIGDKNWTDYAFESKIKLKKGTVFITIRSNGGYFYNVSINTSDISLAKWNASKSEYKVVKSVSYPIQLNKWYLVRVEIVGQQYKLYIDNKLVTSYTYETDSPITKGGIGYYIGGGEIVQLDDVRVWILK